MLAKHPGSANVRAAAVSARAQWVATLEGSASSSAGKDDLKGFAQAYRDALNLRVKKSRTERSDGVPMQVDEDDAPKMVAETQTAVGVGGKVELENKDTGRKEDAVEIVLRNTVTGESHAFPINVSQLTLNGLNVSGLNSLVADSKVQVEEVEVAPPVAESIEAPVAEVQEMAVEENVSAEKADEGEKAVAEPMEVESAAEKAVGEDVEAKPVDVASSSNSGSEVVKKSTSDAGAQGQKAEAGAISDAYLKQLVGNDSSLESDSDSDGEGSEGSGGDLPSLCDEPPDDF